ncbi:barstar family protein [Streptomyces sp. NPDC088732]|uniref:barstar family protein n=1 Tax=Streptomyces sp. NPDC088732 TaxID=3365879 RepID=UPI0038271590
MTNELSELVERGGLVFRIDGRELIHPMALFRVFARELSFADYFGHNWDALADCLQDWHGPGHGELDVAVVIDDADGLLDADFLGLFVSVLCQAAWQANLRLDADGMADVTTPRFALHFVFALRRTPPACFTEAVRTGMDVVTSLSGRRLTATLAGEDWPGALPSTGCP